jgi:hypothetical protein
MVIWLIEHYYELYEFSDITVAKRPMVLRKLVGHTGSVLSLNCYKNFIISFDSHGIIRIWLTDSWNDEGELASEKVEAESEPPAQLQHTDHANRHAHSVSVADVSTLIKQGDAEEKLQQEDAVNIESNNNNATQQPCERKEDAAVVGGESEATGASSGDPTSSSSIAATNSSLNTSSSATEQARLVASLRRPSSRGNKAAISLSENSAAMASSTNQVAKPGQATANLFGKLAGLESGGQGRESGVGDEAKESEFSAGGRKEGVINLADSSEEAIAALRRPSRPLSSNRTASAKLLMYLERTENTSRSDVFDNLSPRYHVDLGGVGGEATERDSAILAQLSPRYQEKTRQPMNRDEISASEALASSNSNKSPIKPFERERSLDRQQIKGRKLGRESSDPSAPSKFAQKEKLAASSKSRDTRVTGHERVASDGGGGGGVSFDLTPIAIPNSIARRELVTNPVRPTSSPDVSNIRPSEHRLSSPRGDNSPRNDRERYDLSPRERALLLPNALTGVNRSDHTTTPPISPRGGGASTTTPTALITSEVEGVYSLPGKTSGQGAMFRKSPRIQKRGVTNLNQLFNDAMASDGDDAGKGEGGGRNNTTRSIVSSDQEPQHYSQPQPQQPRRPSIGPPRVSRSEPHTRHRSVSVERPNIERVGGGGANRFMDVDFDLSTVPVSRIANTGEQTHARRMIPSKSDGNVNQITRKPPPSIAYTATAPLGGTTGHHFLGTATNSNAVSNPLSAGSAGFMLLSSPRSQLGRMGVLSNHRGTDPAMRGQPRQQLELKIENPFYFRFYHSYNVNDRFNFRPIITNHYLWLIVKATIKVC